MTYNYHLQIVIVLLKRVIRLVTLENKKLNFENNNVSCNNFY